MINFICDRCGQPIMIDVPAKVYDEFGNEISLSDWYETVREKTDCTYVTGAGPYPKMYMFCKRCSIVQNSNESEEISNA